MKIRPFFPSQHVISAGWTSRLLNSGTVHVPTAKPDSEWGHDDTRASSKLTNERSA